MGGRLRSGRGEAPTPLRLGTYIHLILSTPLTWIPRDLRVGWVPARARGSPDKRPRGMLRGSGSSRRLLGAGGRGLCALRCTAGPAFSSGCGLRTLPAPPAPLPHPLSSGCSLPLDPVPPSLHSTWAAAAHPACGPWGSHGPGHGPRRLPIPFWGPRSCPLTFNPFPLFPGAWRPAPKTPARFEKGGATGMGQDPRGGGQAQSQAASITSLTPTPLHSSPQIPSLY